jgi:hypothetical protein
MVREIYDLARVAEMPISVLSLQSTILLGKEDWMPEEVERISSEVLILLIRNGWQGYHPTDPSKTHSFSSLLPPATVQTPN